MRLSRSGANAGFSIIELTAVLAIIGILTTLLVPISGEIRKKIEYARCAGQLRSLQVSFGTYLADNGNIWPQPAEDITPEAETKFWLDALAPYGGSDIEVWHCPTLMRMAASSDELEEQGNALHYLPTLFDELPGTASKWPNMPWLLEVGNFHSNGNLAAYPDGSVRPFFE